MCVKLVDVAIYSILFKLTEFGFYVLLLICNVLVVLFPTCIIITYNTKEQCTTAYYTRLNNENKRLLNKSIRSQLIYR